MSGTVVLVVALGGLGCQNKACGVFPAPQSCNCSGGACPAPVYASSAGPLGYSAHVTGECSGDDASGYPGGALRATLISFILGRDDVPTVHEIESSFYSGRYSGRYGFMVDAPSAVSPTIRTPATGPAPSPPP